MCTVSNGFGLNSKRRHLVGSLISGSVLGEWDVFNLLSKSFGYFEAIKEVSFHVNRLIRSDTFPKWKENISMKIRLEFLKKKNFWPNKLLLGILAKILFGITNLLFGDALDRIELSAFFFSF